MNTIRKITTVAVVALAAAGAQASENPVRQAAETVFFSLPATDYRAHAKVDRGQYPAEKEYNLVDFAVRGIQRLVGGQSQEASAETADRGRPRGGRAS